MELDLNPAQPSEVAKSIAAVLAPSPPPVDPWWQAGVEEALYGEATARPRSTFGADLA
jgi:hypothetical protein